MISLIMAASDFELVKKAWALGEAFMNKSSQVGWIYTKNESTSEPTYAILGNSKNGSGVYGLSAAAEKAGVYGYNSLTTGYGHGVVGETKGYTANNVTGSFSAGVFGNASGDFDGGAFPNAAGVYGTSFHGYGVIGSGGEAGVYGKSVVGDGVYGYTQSTDFRVGAVVGKSSSTFGGIFSSKNSRGQIFLETLTQNASNRSTSCEPGELRSEDNGPVSRLYYCEGNNHWKIIILGDP